MTATGVRSTVILTLSLGLLAAGCAHDLGGAASGPKDSSGRNPARRLVAIDSPVRVGAATRIVFLPASSQDSARVVGWTVEHGTIEGGDSDATFIAPVDPDSVWIHARYAAGKDSAEVSLHLFVFRQWIVLKADDLLTDGSGELPKPFRRFFAFLKDRKLRAGVGLVGNSLESARPGYAQEIRAAIADGTIEVWNHGYTHGHSVEPRSGEQWEFRNTPLDFQVVHLRRTQSLARKQLGVTLRAFGAPFNEIDSTTVAALRAVPDISIWLYGASGAGKIVFPKGTGVENPSFNPVFDYFRQLYDPAAALLTLQIHPGGWDDARWMEFEKVIDFLVAQGATFTTPSGYYGMLHPEDDR